jgi:hypothetical protein
MLYVLRNKEQRCLYGICASWVLGVAVIARIVLRATTTLNTDGVDTAIGLIAVAIFVGSIASAQYNNDGWIERCIDRSIARIG